VDGHFGTPGGSRRATTQMSAVLRSSLRFVYLVSYADKL